jgi:phenylacetate-CoA ligase
MAKAATDGYMFAPEIETMPGDKLAALQLERLKKTLRHAYDHVPHYKKSFDAAGVMPDDLKGLEDLVRFPFTVKDDLRDNYPFGMFAVPRTQVMRVHASSGTTGKPTVVGYTAEDVAVWGDLMARTLACAGARPGDIVHNAYGYGLFTGGLGAHYGAERLGCTVVPVSGGLTERQILLIRDLGARVLCATPSYALNIAEVADAAGMSLRDGPLAIGIFGAEPWSQAMRGELDRRLGIEAVDIYGLSEVVGPGVAAECVEARAGLHGWEDCFLFETVDPETGAPVAAGEAGELVVTTLAKWAQPMIRYRTRDITRLCDAPCACGRTHRRLLRITGRSDDMLIIRGVNLYPSQLEAVLIGRPNIAPHYQLVVTREGAMDALSVEVEASPGVDAAVYADITADVAHQIKGSIGITCRVAVLEPGKIPRSQGKAVRVRDLRAEQAGSA